MWLRWKEDGGLKVESVEEGCSYGVEERDITGGTVFGLLSRMQCTWALERLEWKEGVGLNGREEGGGGVDMDVTIGQWEGCCVCGSFSSKWRDALHEGSKGKEGLVSRSITRLCLFGERNRFGTSY